MNRHGQTICLNMIVKNEAPVIERCLSSVLPFIDTWVIVDTGSQDGTQDIIRHFLRDLPGMLVERPWVDFAHNRSEALVYARDRADYVFVIDADETVELAPGFEIPHLTADSYNVTMRYGGVSYLRKQLVNNHLPWYYVGVLHEYIQSDHARTDAYLPGIQTVPHRDGARARDPQTYRRDALVLERALLDDPNNARYMFYLAQSYRDAGDAENAIRYYRRRVALGGWREEVWYSLYQIANLRASLDHPWSEVTQEYLIAYQFNPTRAEPLFRLGTYHQAKREYAISNLYYSQARTIPPLPLDALFVETPIYEYLLALEYAVSCFYVGKHDAAIRINNTLLRERRIPPAAIDQVVKNRRFSLDVIYRAEVPALPPIEVLRIYILHESPVRSVLDDCLDSLMAQTETHFTITVISADDRLNVPDDPRLSLIYSAPSDMPAHLTASIHESCLPNDAVVVLSSRHRLQDSGVLTILRQAFENPSCDLVYGQYRESSGELGDHEPAPDAESFVQHGLTINDGAPIGFRAALRDDWSGGGVTEQIKRLAQSVGFARTQYVDPILSIINDPPRTVSVQVGSQPASLPLISCLMVTLDRLSLAKQSIRCFADQTYSNRELVIVTDGSARFQEALRRYIEESNLSNVRLITRSEPGTPLGELRNLALDSAHGSITCQWDDDDLNHARRLEIQYNAMIAHNARVSYLTDQLQYLEDKNSLLWIDWTFEGTIHGQESLIPGTLMMFQDMRVRYPQNGPYARRGEDSALLYSLYDHLPIHPVSGHGYLYVYRYHGRNTFPQQHHHRMGQFGLTAAKLQEHEPLLRQVVTDYPLPKPLSVMGRDGVAFGITK